MTSKVMLATQRMFVAVAIEIATIMSETCATTTTNNNHPVKPKGSQLPTNLWASASGTMWGTGYDGEGIDTCLPGGPLQISMDVDRTYDARLLALSVQRNLRPPACTTNARPCGPSCTTARPHATCPKTKENNRAARHEHG